MRILLFIVISVISFQTADAQWLFGKEKIRNLDNFDKKRFSYGYTLGFNSYDFDFDYINQTQDIIVEKSVGFNVGLLGNMRINDYIDLRFEPMIAFVSRNLVFPFAGVEDRDILREVKSTYIHMPLLVKFSTKRLNNFKPFVVGGVSTSINLSSNQDNPDDNSVGQFRMTDNTYYYEIGFGVDLYLYYFKFTPSIRGVFAMSDELVRDADPNSVYTSNIDKMSSRGVFINFTFQ